MKVKKAKKKIVVRDPNAKAMWGRSKTSVFKDKTKYNRKIKYKNNSY